MRVLLWWRFAVVKGRHMAITVVTETSGINEYRMNATMVTVTRGIMGRHMTATRTTTSSRRYTR